MRVAVWLFRVRVKSLRSFVIIAVAKFFAQFCEGQRAVRIRFARLEGFESGDNAGGGGGDHTSRIGADLEAEFLRALLCRRLALGARRKDGKGGAPGSSLDGAKDLIFICG